ncbi:OmpA family protein [Spirulina major CS-329]|uniref:OmpA family protein n=1 Tax=Spirulina TaxID=1154 RepID=UPI00232DE4CD|nr:MULTISPECIES: OmpA family protein [Spirulina]MDB9495225.1 OmpA family protein [Spirulina subsalsa CS-330]MDB9503007.1 OmpA family protein [Spirulina major CS-329]
MIQPTDQSKNRHDYLPTQPPARSWPGWLWDGTLRLILLGFGSTLAMALGVAIALNREPNVPASQPFLAQLWDAIQRPAPVASSQTTALSQPLSTEIERVDAQWQQLRDRITILESQLGLSPTESPLRDRIAQLQETVQAQATPPLSQTANLPGQRLQITLPNDLLFNEANTISDSGTTILDAIVGDLSAYSGQTIRIAVHTNHHSDPTRNRELSYQLAQTVETYLKQEVSARWVAIGYGDRYPITPDPSSDREAQQNRRLEIAID